ncbi:hypothetical protein [Blastococcus sp. CT_GayMR16]|uniref:hypothetical protein n=1 Tax=Blastococcus sp. CT_GayMR16 TaxID=2559607 RepID=UPI0014303F03|nr:hypothetical protein [Blastococcus sp. CT_GayMR16]
MIHPVRDADNFTEEQVAVRGVDSFWGLPEHPRTACYRSFNSPVDHNSHGHGHPTRPDLGRRRAAESGGERERSSRSAANDAPANQ